MPYQLFASFAQGPGPLTQQQRELADYIKSHYTKREVMIPMRDGVKLFTSIYEPKDTKQKYPFMFDRTCYSVRLTVRTNFARRWGRMIYFRAKVTSSSIRTCAGVT